MQQINQNSHINQSNSVENQWQQNGSQQSIQKLQPSRVNNIQINDTTAPFIIQSFNRQQRARDRANKPKLGLRRLAQDKKLVSVDIDIHIDQNTVIKDRFDWDLARDKMAPSDFAKQLVVSLKLPQQFIQKIKQQILSQIMQHIKANTCQKQQQRQIFANQQQSQMNKNNFNNMRFSYTEYPQDDLMEKQQQNQRKMLSRRRIKQIKKAPTYLPNQQGRQTLNFDDKRVKIAAKYYQKIANKIPLLTYQAKKKNFQKEDFDSFYAIYNKIKGIFQASDQLSKQNLNQVKYIMQKYHQYFLNGNLDCNDQDIIQQIFILFSDKQMKKGDKKQQQGRPKRMRGRPRKIKIINDDLIINSNPNSQQQQSQQNDSQSDDSSS